MNLLEFANKFPDKATCRQRFKEIRVKEGVECKKCTCTDHYWLSTREQFQCRQYSSRTTLTSGTVTDYFIKANPLTDFENFRKIGG